MRVGSFLLDASPVDALDALRALQGAGFLQRAPAADLGQLSEVAADPLVTALRARPNPSLDELALLLRDTAGARTTATINLYARLVPPELLADKLRVQVGEALGVIANDVDDRAPVDPFEIVLPLSLSDRDGSARARAFRGWRVDPLSDDGQLHLLVEGRELTDFTLSHVTELRLLEEGVGYLALALALAHAWPRPIYLVDLD
jgi:hypothetical protein